MNDIIVPVDVDVQDASYSLRIAAGEEIDVHVDTTITTSILDHYGGPYSVTPSASSQVLHTQGMAMDEDVTIGAIPNNYGLITWNGSYLTVS